MAETSTAAERMTAALNDPDHLFTAGQVAYIISLILGDGTAEDQAYRAGDEAGYWRRVAEENAAYPPAPFDLSTSAREDSQRVYRARMGVDVIEARPEDFGGGRAALADLIERERDWIEGDPESG